MAVKLSLPDLSGLTKFGRQSKKDDSLPPAAIGKVIEADSKYIIATVQSPIELHRHYLIEVRSVANHILIAQIESLVSKEVKIGVRNEEGSISFLGAGATITRTRDEQETRVLLTARIVSFINSAGKVVAYLPTMGYVNQPAFLADYNNLLKVFAELDEKDATPLEVGTVVESEFNSHKRVPASFNPLGFMRHTAVFGQSGSGKSFSFGIVLEELIAKTDARVIVFDPNSDYRNFTQIRTPSEITKDSERDYDDEDHRKVFEIWNQLKPHMLRFSLQTGPTGTAPLSLLFSDIRRANQCTLAGLDPVLDYEDYRTFCEVLDELGPKYDLAKVLEQLNRRSTLTRLLQRIRNRELDKLRLLGPTSIIQTLRDEDWRFVAIDLKIATSLERSIAAAAILEALYRDMVAGPSKVTFFVVDEAHNFCPRMPWDVHQNPPTQILQEIAAEGRKYGAFLILITQNPSKLNEQAMTQCDNVILMNMTSGAEVRALDAVIKDAGPGLSGTVFGLRKGEAVCMGGIVRNEVIVKFDLRKTQPGGDDVSKGWAKRKITSGPRAAAAD